jgi:transforming growth factor-beta-induced protein
VKLNLIAIPVLVGVLALGGVQALAGDCGGCQGDMKVAKADIVDTAIKAGSFTTLVKAVQAAGLVDTLKGKGPFTVFAPTDAAFANVPADTLNALLANKDALTKVLTYHVVSGEVPASKATTLSWADTVNGQAARITLKDGAAYIDNAKIIKTDIRTSNGIIHVIDAVILPRKDIVDTAVSAGKFNTLVTAVKAAGLAETLKGKGPFTVFAPSDSAFAKLPAGTIDALLKDKSALAGILTYHVIPGRVLAEDLPVGKRLQVETVNGASLTVERARDGSVRIDGAKVVTADVIAGNGVIHVIDSVVIPQTN